MDTYGYVILGTLIGFITIAFLLLFPVWRFLEREEEVSEQWTREALAQRRKEQASDEETGPGISPGASHEEKQH